MNETRKLVAILVADVVGYSRLTGADEDRILARLRTLRSDLIDPTIAVHHGRIVKRTGDGSIVEFRSVVDEVNLAIEVQRAMVERNAGRPGGQADSIPCRHPSRRRRGGERRRSHGDRVNIAARLESVAKLGAICYRRTPYRQVRADWIFP
jgi:class 3 adenylate cyclase